MNGNSVLEFAQFAIWVSQLALQERGVELQHLASRQESGTPVDDLERDFAKIEAEYTAQIDASISAWTENEPLPPLPPIPRAWRRTRLTTASGFLLEQRAACREMTANQMLPAENWSRHQATRWLLTDWWYSRGRRRFAQTMLDSL